MRIGVIGAGAVGGLLAALLHRAGHDVEVTARGDHLAAIQRDGLRVEGGFGVIDARVRAGAELSARPDLAILATKAQDAAAALAANAGHLRGVPLLVVQNGLGGLDVARRSLPGSPLLGGLALFATSFLAPGRITVTAALPIVLGGAPDTSPAAVAVVADTLGAALEVEVVRDLEGAQWTKLLVNHVNALPAITGLSVQETIADDGLCRVLAASLRESVRVARLAGVRFAALQGIPGWLLPLLGVAPLAVVAAFPRMLARRMGAVPNPGSTLQSLRRGRLTEIDSLNGAVVRVAAEHGRQAPLNAALVAAVHDVESRGEFWSVERARRLAQRGAGAIEQ